MTDLGVDFYPIYKDSARVYQVEETLYNLVGAETNFYQLRGSISDSLVSSSGEITYILQREKRNTANDPWRVDSLWSVRKTDRLLVITENNVPLVKLTFPAKEGAEWDGNAFNTHGYQEYYYEGVETEKLKSEAYSNDLIKVVIADEPQNLVRRDERYEVYEKGVGLLEKNYITLEYCTKDCESTEQIISGRILYQYLISND